MVVRTTVSRFGGQSLFLRGLLAALFLVVAVFVGTSPGAELQTPLDPFAQWGIELVSLRLTAAGSIVDFRYKVTDPRKAAYLLNRNQQGHLIDDATGKTFVVPNMGKVGSLRQSTLAPEPGRVYFMLFGNAGRLLKSGSRVTVVIGDARFPGLMIQ